MHTLTVPRASTPSFAAVATAAAVWSIVAVVYPSWVGLAAASTLAIGTVAALIDLRSHRLPNQVVLLALVPSAVASVAVDAVLPATLGALVLGGPLLLAHLASPAAMGFGDVKFGAVLGVAVGLFGPAWSLVALCIASGTTSLIGLIRRSPSLPFGPGLVVGAVAAVVASPVVTAGFSDGRPPWR